MYRITYGDSVVFDPYDDDLTVTNAKMSAEINAASYLDFTISMRHPLYNAIEEHDQVVGLYFDGATLFLGVVDSIETDVQGSKSISCVSALDYLNDTVVRPYSTISGDGTLTAPTSIDGYFQWLIDQHNAHVMDLQKRFEIGVNQGGSLSRTNYITPSSSNYPTTADEIMSNMLDAYGGYLTMRYDGDRKILDLYSDVHDMNPQIVDFGVNITDFTKTVSTESQYTALIPLGGSPSMDDGGFESGSYSEWVEHPDTPLVGSPVHQGSNSSYFTSGSGEYINKVCFYVKKGARYKATVWVKNERSSDVTVRFGYQLNTNDIWSNHNVANASMAVSNDGEWKEFSVDFMPDASENVGMRPRWYFDSVSEDRGKRVYVDDFDFRQINGDSDVDEDSISLKLIPDGIAPRNSDVAIEGESIYSIDAVREYGYREKTWSDDSITDVDALLESAIVQLNKSRNPEISVDVKAVDLALYMDGYDHLQIGQAVRVRSKIHGIDEYLMVSSIDLDLQDPGQTDYILGISYDTFTGQQSSYLRMLNGGINSSLDQVTALDQTTKDQAIKIGSVEQVANQAQQTANNAQNTANNAQNTANSNKEAISSIKDAQTEYEKQLEQMQAGVEQAEQEISGINDRLDQMDTEAGEVQASIDAVRQEAQTNFETAKAAADAAQAKADSVGADLESFRTETGESIQNVKDSVSGVQSDVDAVTQKAADLASELDGTKATVEQVTTDLGEVKTTVSNAATKADQALQVSTSASQTATEARTTATSAYQDAQSALTQSSTASQTANAVKTELETKYSTTDEIAEQYATKSLVEQTSQSITSTVEATYATKATVEALENIANNAVQTWMGSGVPTLSNKPASDWTTAELKSQHSGDIYYDTDTGYSYRFGSSDGKNYLWSLIKDTDISKAVADAAKAQQTAEGVSDEVTQLKTDIPATYATKTDVKQTTDSIKSTVSEVATTANNALSKASTVEQTANGLQTTVTEQAEKLDSAVTTISQVSQKVDSVSSTITQVSGRVDDVEDKADAAQGTANSAMSQASRVEQSLDSFKTSVSRDYQTKTDALSQKSELEQNINSFKTTVSETYTTKDEFNALEIGGTNLAEQTGTMVTSDFNLLSTTGTSSIVSDDEVPSGNVFSFTPDSGKNLSVYYNKNGRYIPKLINGETYTVSAWVKFKNATGTIGSYFCRAEFLNEVSSYRPAPSTTWKQYWVTGTYNDNTSALTAITFYNYRDTGDNTVYISSIKVEKGNKATAWSPAPEDFDGKYTSKTEFKQTTDKISATATAASQNASSALSKVSSLEVSVDGIDAKVEENASDIADAVKTTSQVSQRVDSLSSTITQVQGDVKTAKDTANSALSKSSSVEQNLNSFKTSVSQTYETKSDASSKQSSLQQSVNNLRTEVSQTYTTKTDFTNLNNAATKTYQFHTSINQTGWYKLGTWSNTNQSDVCAITIYAGNGQNGRPDQNREVRVFIKDGYQSTASASGAFGVTIDRIRNADNAEVQVRATAANSCDVWYKGDTTYAAGRYTISIDPSSKWTHSGSFTTSAPSSGTLQTQEYQTYSTKSYVDQTSRTVSLGVVEEYKNGQHGSALATQSDITAAKDSITSTVSQTYLSKNDASVQYATKTQVQQTSDSLTVRINESMSMTRGSVLVANGDFETGTTSGWTFSGFNAPYVNTTTPYTGSYKLVAPRGGSGNNNMVNSSVIPVYQGQKFRFRCALNPDNTISNDLSIGFIGDNGALIIYKVPIVTGGGWHVYTCTLTVPSGVTSMRARIATNNTGFGNLRIDSVTVTDVTEGANAQSTANTANSNAQNAQNRVGNLETCIKMTSDGVRVGKISNGNFTGYSALVNSAGSFDVLDPKGNAVVRFGSVTISGASKATTTIGNIESDSLAFNGSPVNGSFITFTPQNYADGSSWQFLPRDGSQSMAFANTIHDFNAYSQFIELESSTKRCFRCAHTGWYLVGGIIELQQQTGANARIEGRWMLSTSIDGAWNATSYVPDFVLVHEVDDYSYNERDRWHRITLPTQFVKLTKNQLIKYQLRITQDYPGEHASEIIVGSRTYLNFFKLPFNTM